MATLRQPNGPRRFRGKGPWIWVAAGVALVLVGLAAYLFFIRPQPLDTAPIENQLEQSPELLPSLPFDEVERVECPEDVEVDEGGEFQCIVFGPGGLSSVVDLVQEDSEGSVEIVTGD